MALPTLTLDDRNFQDIVDEAKKRIPHYCKEWTDHNLSDPGVTLIELFAWMTDITLYRLNQVPDLHYLKMMEMLGITLREPAPAKVAVSFWLSKPQSIPVVIPANTEVASTQTETDRPIVFTTDHAFRIDVPELTTVLSRTLSSESGQKAYRKHNLRGLVAGLDGIEVFSKTPQVDDALYFGFENDLSHHILGFDLDFDPAGGAGIDPTLPPYIWEASTGHETRHWEVCQVEIDQSNGMNRAGHVQVHLPKMGVYNTGKIDAYWVRVRVKEITQTEAQSGMRPYQTSPVLRRLTVAAWGATVPTTHAQQVNLEFLGQSDGAPGQRFSLKSTPILTRASDEHLVVQLEGEPPQIWDEVADFSASSAQDRHYTLDSLSGEIRFGPAIRQPDGTIKLYGAVPPRGANLVFARYRYGGGQIGNVQAAILNTLKTAIPYIARVSNHQPAWGGLDPETIEAAKMRVPAMLRSRERAVTADDFEFLARQALPAAIGRVKCLQPSPSDAGRVTPGQVFVLVIPRLPDPAVRLDPARLQLNPADVETLTHYLDQRRLLTTRLEVRPPAYYWVSVHVQLRAAPGEEKSVIESQVLSRLYRYLNPLSGGPDGQGWPFGRDLFVSDVYQCLQGIPKIQFVRGLTLRVAQPGGSAQGSPVEAIEVVAHGVIASGIHSVEFV